MNLPRFCCCLASGLLAAAATQVAADDLAPPPFRGQPHSVMAKFDLFAGQVPGGPSSINLVGGVYPPSTVPPFVDTPITDPSSGALIYPITLPNFIDPLPLKQIRIQYSWFDAIPGPTGDAQTLLIDPIPGGAVQLVGSSTPSLVPGTSNVYHRWDDYEIIPNPDWEIFEIAFFNADPRWVVIDTISIPEPSAMVIVALGGVLAVAGRRG